jgi:MoaA/NifB/PqqE/SkfB family radical SAM enzyme
MGIFRIRVLKQRVPLTVCFELTQRCPAHCSYCFIIHNPAKELRTSEIFATIDGLRAAGTARIAFSGGEALLRPDLPDIIAYARKSGIWVSVNTSGMGVRKAASRLEGANAVVVSLNGDREAHELSRQGSRYDEAIECIDWALARGIDVVTITVITRNNVHALPHVFELARRKGFWCNIQPLFKPVQPDKPFPEDLMLTRDELAAAVKTIRAARASGYPVMNSHAYLKFLSDIAAGKDTTRHCSWALGACIINPDGKMVACQAFPKEKVTPSGTVEALLDDFRRIERPTCSGICPGAHYEMGALFELEPWAIANALRLQSARLLQKCMKFLRGRAAR